MVQTVAVHRKERQIVSSRAIQSQSRLVLGPLLHLRVYKPHVKSFGTLDCLPAIFLPYSRSCRRLKLLN